MDRERMEILGGDFYESDVWTEFYIYQDGNAFYLRGTIGEDYLYHSVILCCHFH